jgi:hypothetical protein
MISNIYKSNALYSWESGKHNKKAHAKALKAQAKKNRKKKQRKPKLSAMGWPM